MPKDNEVDEKAVAWLITYTERDGSKRQAVYTHNAIADWRMFDPAATSEPLTYAATVAELRAEVERLRADAYKFRRLARLLDGFDFRLGRNVLMPPATYLDSVEITCEFQPGVGQSVIDAIMDTLTGADPT